MGKGLFTSVKIPANSMIMEITGPILADYQIDGNSEQHFQIGPNVFLAPAGEVSDELNHHCDPNCYLHCVGNRAFLYSLYLIPVSAELTIDYSATSTDTIDEWQMECKCGSHKCRRTISGHHYLGEELKEKYVSKNMLPIYITEPQLISRK